MSLMAEVDHPGFESTLQSFAACIPLSLPLCFPINSSLLCLEKGQKLNSLKMKTGQNTAELNQNIWQGKNNHKNKAGSNMIETKTYEIQ